jgi:hypothetical protein
MITPRTPTRALEAAVDDRSTPEITAAHILAVLSPTAPAGAVIAIRRDDEHVVVCPVADTTDWRSRTIAVIVATRSEVAAALDPGERRDLAAIDALAEDLTEHAETLLAAGPAAA